MDTQSRDRLIVLLVISVILILFVILWVRYKFTPDPEPERRPIPVSTVQPVISDLREELVLSAVLEAERTIIIVPKVAGTILEILAEEGAVVTEGEILAHIDPEPYLLELQAAESAWLLADSSLSRINRIHESSGASRQQLDEARAARDAAYSTYELARMRFSYSDIRSPVSGLVLRRFSDSGNLASPEQPLFVVGDDADPQVKVRIPEKYWHSFTEPGSIKVLVSFPAGGDETILESELLRVSPSISPEGKTFEVTCSVPTDGNSWPIGARMRVEIILSEKKNSWSLPLRSQSGDGGIWIVDSDSFTVSRLDDPGIFRDNERFAVPAEWAGGIFVLDGHHLLQEGQIVTPFDGGT